MKILFLAMYYPGRAPSQRFRFEQYLDFLQSKGVDCTISYIISEKSDAFFHKSGHLIQKGLLLISGFIKRCRDMGQLKKYDAVFVCRESFFIGIPLFEAIVRKSKAKLIFDFDDAIWLVYVSKGNSILGWLKSKDKTRKIISYADRVIAGNNYLANYARKHNSDVVIIPTSIDTKKYTPLSNKPAKERVIIGWSGSFSTIPCFEVAIPALRRIKKYYKELIDFLVVGDGNYQNTELEIVGKQWQLQTELDDLRSMDIGIMPLPDDEWHRGKCGFKGLLYMALEIPAVMSPVGVNCDIIQDGVNGFLPKNEEDWVEKISLLIEDPELRQRIGKNGRRTVIERYSMEANKHLYLKAVSGAQ